MEVQTGEVFERIVARHNSEEKQMNWEQVEGKWKQYTGKAKEQWGKLTDDDLQQIAGKRDQLIGKIQERYGIKKEEAMQQVDQFSRSLDASNQAERENVRAHRSGQQ
jgi:uncharacterized protein YjbJ (UPF0337 family)